MSKKRKTAEQSGGGGGGGDDEESSVRSGHVHFAGGAKKASLFCYLMFDSNDKERRTTSIDTATDPAGAVLAYKTGQKKHRKGGRSNPREWCLEQWIGPFRSKETALRFQTRWSHSKKSLPLRIVRGAQLAIQFSQASRTKLYTYSMHPTELIAALHESMAEKTPSSTTETAAAAPPRKKRRVAKSKRTKK